MSPQAFDGPSEPVECSESDLAVLVKECQQPDSYDSEGLDAWIVKLKRVAEIQANFRLRKLKEMESLHHKIADITKQIEDCTESNQELRRQIDAASAPQNQEGSGVVSHFVEDENNEELRR